MRLRLRFEREFGDLKCTSDQSIFNGVQRVMLFKLIASESNIRGNEMREPMLCGDRQELLGRSFELEHASRNHISHGQRK